MRQKHIRGGSSGAKKERTSASAAATSTSHGKRSAIEEHTETESSYINNMTDRSNAETNEVDNSPIEELQRTEETKGESQIELR